MKKKFLPLFMVIVFGFIFIVFYKGLEDSNIYTPDTKLKNKVPIFKTKDFYSGVSLNSGEGSTTSYDVNYEQSASRTTSLYRVASVNYNSGATYDAEYKTIQICGDLA